MHVHDSAVLRAAEFLIQFKLWAIRTKQTGSKGGTASRISLVNRGHDRERLVPWLIVTRSITANAAAMSDYTKRLGRSVGDCQLLFGRLGEVYRLASHHV